MFVNLSVFYKKTHLLDEVYVVPQGFPFDSLCSLRVNYSPKYTAIIKYVHKKSLTKMMKLMWSHKGSNLGPSDYESDALTN